MDGKESGGIMIVYVWECECEKRKCTLSKLITVNELVNFDYPCPYEDEDSDVFIRETEVKE